MTVDPMFLDQHLQVTFDKVSSQIKLSDNPDRWQAEVSTQIYAFVPYLADYAINIVFDKVDAQRGAAIGRVEVTPRSEAATKDEQESLPKVLIPLVVTDRLLQPVDIFMDGEGVYPLSEWRLKEQLMRPSAFETSTRQPTDQGMVDQLYPPMRTNYGYGNAVATGVGMGGFGKFASMLESIAHTITPSEATDFVERFQQDRELAMLATRDPGFQKLAFTVAGAANNGSVVKTAEALADSIKPTVIQMQKLADGNFRVKWANRRAFLEKTADFPPEQAGNMAGTDKVMELSPGSTMTLSTEKVQKTNLSNERVEVIKDFGQYRCQTEPDNQQLVGWVLPVMDFEMHPLPLFLFTDGQSYSLQDEIAGSRVGHNLELPQGQPQGDGCFYYVENERAVALLPLTIMSSMGSPEGGQGFMAETVFGDQVQIQMSPNLQAVQMGDDGSYLIPDTMLWLPLQTAIHLAKTPEEVGNVSKGQQAGGAVDITPSGQDQVSLDGAPMLKVARDQREFISHAQAEFLLVAAGADPFEVKEKLAHAQRYGEAQMTGLLSITPLADVHRAMVKEAARALADFPYDLKRDMVKEAAALNDAHTADKVLSLGFLNPENIALFASYLPHLDDTSKKLAEMLLAARLGQRQINEEAVERCMHHMEKVIMCLRALNQKERM